MMKGSPIGRRAVLGLAGAGALLPEVEQSLAAGRYLEAKSRAESALATAQGVKDQVLAAIALAQGA